MTTAFRLRLAEIQQRRELLVDRAAEQRGELAAVCAEFRRPLELINRVASIADWFRARPGTAGVSLLTAVLAMTSARRWIGRAVMLYQFVKFIRERLKAPHDPGSLAVRDDMEAT
ncbi:MAG TPA: hypothetical protein VGN70_09945 [Gammaproteobacteria bacterium]|jgi:hypothetical protein